MCIITHSGFFFYGNSLNKISLWKQETMGLRGFILKVQFVQEDVCYNQFDEESTGLSRFLEETGADLRIR